VTQPACLVVTRPAEQAQTWVLALEAQGLHALALPLIDIVAPPDDRDLRHWREHLAQAQVLMFVSGAAVRAFFATSPPVAASMAKHTRFWAPGPGTAQALAEALPGWGLSAQQIDAPAITAEQFDSEALWDQVQHQVRPGHTVVIVGGGGGRDWLTQRCQAAGAEVHTCVAYARQAPTPNADWWARYERARAPGCVWLFSSSQALGHLKTLLPNEDWTGRAALVTHPRMTSAAQSLGFGRVYTSRPTLVEVVKTLESHHHE